MVRPALKWHGPSLALIWTTWGICNCYFPLSFYALGGLFPKLNLTNIGKEKGINSTITKILLIIVQREVDKLLSSYNHLYKSKCSITLGWLKELRAVAWSEWINTSKGQSAFGIWKPKSDQHWNEKSHETKRWKLSLLQSDQEIRRLRCRGTCSRLAVADSLQLLCITSTWKYLRFEKDVIMIMS